jgi:hypothetical protein
MSSRGCFATRADSPPPGLQPRAHMYTHAAKAWALSLGQGPFSVVPNPSVTIRSLFVAVGLRVLVSPGEGRSRGQ